MKKKYQIVATAMATTMAISAMPISVLAEEEKTDTNYAEIVAEAKKKLDAIVEVESFDDEKNYYLIEGATESDLIEIEELIKDVPDGTEGLKEIKDVINTIKTDLKELNDYKKLNKLVEQIVDLVNKDGEVKKDVTLEKVEELEKEVNKIVDEHGIDFGGKGLPRFALTRIEEIKNVLNKDMDEYVKEMKEKVDSLFDENGKVKLSVNFDEVEQIRDELYYISQAKEKEKEDLLKRIDEAWRVAYNRTFLDRLRGLVDEARKGIPGTTEEEKNSNCIIRYQEEGKNLFKDAIETIKQNAENKEHSGEMIELIYGLESIIEETNKELEKLNETIDKANARANELTGDQKTMLLNSIKEAEENKAITPKAELEFRNNMLESMILETMSVEDVKAYVLKEVEDSKNVKLKECEDEQQEKIKSLEEFIKSENNELDREEKEAILAINKRTDIDEAKKKEIIEQVKEKIAKAKESNNTINVDDIKAIPLPTEKLNSILEESKNTINGIVESETEDETKKRELLEAASLSKDSIEAEANGFKEKILKIADEKDTELIDRGELVREEVDILKYSSEKYKEEAIERINNYARIKKIGLDHQGINEKGIEAARKKIDSEAKKAKKAIDEILKDDTKTSIENNEAINKIVNDAKEAMDKIYDNAESIFNKGGSSSGSSSNVSTSASRIAGNDRVQTAIKLSKKEFGTAKTVILADKSNFADALTASTLASKNKAPILLVDKNALNKDVKAEIQRLGAKDVIIVGGTNSVGSAVEKAVKDDLKLSVKRLAGADRYATSKAIAEEVFKLTGKRDKAVIANGQVFADALSVSPFAIEKNMPIILVNKNVVPNASKEALKDVKEVYIAGGENTVTKSVEKNLPKIVKRFAGADRYETSANIAKATYSSPYNTYVASGQVFADALVVGPVAAKKDAPILLVQSKNATKYTLDYLKSKSVRNITIVGGENSVNSSVEKELEKAK